MPWVRRSGSTAILPIFDLVPVRNKAAASDRFAIEERERMKRVRVVLVHLDFLRDVLLLDEDAAANIPRLLHLLGVFDCDYL